MLESRKEEANVTIRPELLQLAAGRNLGVLATIKRDGRPQLSNVNFALDAEQKTVRVSVTDDRAKVRNLRRDPRASMFVSSADGWSYAVLEGTVALSDVAQAPHDAAVEELVQLYRDIRGEDHPDWDDYRAAMVRDNRLVATLHIEHTYGMAGR
jgi:PPOX class probable F420-dependent enzyme